MRPLWLLLLAAALFGVAHSNELTNQVKDPDQLKKNVKAVGKAILDNIDEIRSCLRPFLALIPDVGGKVAAVVDFPLWVLSLVLKNKKPSELKEIQSQISDLKVNMHDLHVAQLMSSNIIHQYAAEIEAAWDHYQVYTKDLLSARTSQDIEEFNKRFIKFYRPKNTLTDVLCNELAKPTFQDLLAKSTHCHNNELEDFIIWANRHVFFGSIMNKAYAKLTKSDTLPLLSHFDKETYKYATSIFKVRERCFSQMETSVQDDVDRLLKKENVRELKKKDGSLQQLAAKILKFLSESYRFYDWFVVIYKSKDVKHVVRENKHIMSLKRFWTNDDLNVAVHWQLKGENRHRAQVERVITQCVSDRSPCEKVLDQLNDCPYPVERTRLSRWISAVHIFRGDETQSLDGQRLDFPEFDPRRASKPYYYQGMCKGRFKRHNFYAMIRSDNEAVLRDDCEGRRCGHGTCKLVGLMGICECSEGYYGEQCEKHLAHYPSQAPPLPPRKGRGRAGE